MDKVVRILAGLAIVQIVFVVVANMGGNTLAGQAPNQPLLSFDKEQVDTLIVRAKEKAEIKLSKKEGQWQTEDGFPADQEKVTNLIEKLHGLKHGLPVANSDKAINRFKVVNDSFERHILLQNGDKKLAALYVGSGAGARQTHVRSDEDIAVYSVALGTYDVPDTISDWQNRNALKLDIGDISRIDVMGMTFQRQQSPDKETKTVLWKSAKLPNGKQLDQKAINDGVSSLAGLSFDKVLGKESKPEYGMDNAVLTLKLIHKNGERQYVLGKLKDKDDYVIKVSDRPEYFQLSGNAAKSIVDNITRKNWIKDQANDKAEASEPSKPAQPVPATPADNSDDIKP